MKDFIIFAETLQGSAGAPSKKSHPPRVPVWSRAKFYGFYTVSGDFYCIFGCLFHKESLSLSLPVYCRLHIITLLVFLITVFIILYVYMTF